MEEIVGCLADREKAIRAHAKTLPCRRRRTSEVVVAGAMMTVACIAALAFELVERNVVL
jgi:D-serine deaminase-like pyridoxal phosphate-dependent protein